jgi:cell division septation protein DedD
MRKVMLVCVLVACALPLLAADSPLGLMLDGRFGEAKKLIETSNLSPRYQILYYAMTEADAARACSLYQVIAIRYSESDCDSVARGRLDQARSMGFNVIPIGEWNSASADVTPLFAHRLNVSHPAEPALPSEPKSVAAQPPHVVSAEYGDTNEPSVATPVPVVADQPAPVKSPATSAKIEPTPATSSAPTQTTEPPQNATESVSTGRWYIQVGAFSNENNAHQLAAKLEAAGYTVKFVPREGRKKLLQVRVGGYATRADLNPVMARLREQFDVPTAVVAE